MLTFALGRRIEFDERSRDYPARPLTAEHTAPRSYTWRTEQSLDQGREGACVGFAWAHEAAARPVTEPFITATTGQSIYKEAQTVDEWPGENYEGTSVLAGAKTMLRRGYIREYRWCFSLDELLNTVAWKGPVVCGLNWYEGMFEPNKDGYISPTGRLQGGHAICCHGVNVGKEYVTFINSWGPDWGRNGHCRMAWADLDKLLHEQGEACVPVRRAFAGKSPVN